MIESIQLRNFESHKNTKIQLTHGINIISGESRNGKSSIIRGVYWVRNNKPSGLSMISFWNRDKKDNPIKPTFVDIVLTNGTEIKRERSPEFNGYMVGETKLEAIGQTVPEDIEKAFNITDVNVQYQFDRPFLLDDSPADVARFFNKTIRLDLIDRVQSKAELMRRRTNQEINSGEENIKKLKEQVDEFEWVELAEITLEKAETIEKRMVKNNELLNVLTSMLQEYTKCSDTIKKWDEMKKCVLLINEIENTIKNITEKQKVYDELKATLESYQMQKEIISKEKNISEANEFISTIDELVENILSKEKIYNDLENSLHMYKVQKEVIKKAKIVGESEKLIAEVEMLQKSIDEKNELYTKLKTTRKEYTEMKTIVEESEIELDKLHKLLPSVCPLCNQPINKEKWNGC